MMGGEFKKINLSESTFWYLVVALLTIISLWPIWSVRFPPMQDYPQHLSQVQILSEYSNPDYDYKDNFSADLKPVPYATFYAITFFFFQISSDRNIRKSRHIPIHSAYYISSTKNCAST